MAVGVGWENVGKMAEKKREKLAAYRQTAIFAPPNLNVRN
jgi:hypothetical protein